MAINNKIIVLFVKLITPNGMSNSILNCSKGLNIINKVIHFLFYKQMDICKAKKNINDQLHQKQYLEYLLL